MSQEATYAGHHSISTSEGPMDSNQVPEHQFSSSSIRALLLTKRVANHWFGVDTKSNSCGCMAPLSVTSSEWPPFTGCHIYHLQYCICSTHFSGLARPIWAHQICLCRDFNSLSWAIFYLLCQPNLSLLSTVTSYRYKCITPSSLRLPSTMALHSMIFSYFSET